MGHANGQRGEEKEVGEVVMMLTNMTLDHSRESKVFSMIELREKQYFQYSTIIIKIFFTNIEIELNRSHHLSTDKSLYLIIKFY